MRRAPAFLLVGAILVGGCGDDPNKDAERTVRDFVKATNKRDAKRYCEDLVTQAFVEGATGGRGKGAREGCKRLLRQQQVQKIRIIDIQKTVVHGDRAEVTALLQARGQSRPQVLRLRKQGGDWRIADASGD